jgi:hypothetical protein
VNEKFRAISPYLIFFKIRSLLRKLVSYYEKKSTNAKVSKHELTQKDLSTNQNYRKLLDKRGGSDIKFACISSSFFELEEAVFIPQIPTTNPYTKLSEQLANHF